MNTPVDSAHAALPNATHALSMTEFAYAGPDTWTAGSHLLRVENTGEQDHQLRLIRLHDGSTLAQWMEDDAKHGTPIAGIARMGPGEVAFIPLELSAGNYVAYCLVTDAASKRPHAELGMLRSIQVQ